MPPSTSLTISRGVSLMMTFAKFNVMLVRNFIKCFYSVVNLKKNIHRLHFHCIYIVIITASETKHIKQMHWTIDKWWVGVILNNTFMYIVIFYWPSNKLNVIDDTGFLLSQKWNNVKKNQNLLSIITYIKVFYVHVVRISDNKLRKLFYFFSFLE